MNYKNTALFKLLIKSDVFSDSSVGYAKDSAVSLLEMNSILKQYFRVIRFFQKTRVNKGVFFLLVDNQFLQQILVDYFSRVGIKNISVLTSFPSEVADRGNVLSSFIKNDEKKESSICKKDF